MSTTILRDSAITIVRKLKNINVNIKKLTFSDIGGVCFHTAKTSYHLPLDEAKKGLAMLKDEGMKKVNFSGGEPFLIQGGHYKTSH